ncbi:hypothetical protein THAOC_27035, partial [Thalassiosira oceanica]
IAAILAGGNDDDDNEPPTEVERVIRSMLVPPLRSKDRSAHKLGSLNEANVRQVMSAVCQELGHDLVDCWDAGLLRCDQDQFLATSLDGFLTMRANDDMLRAMPPGRVPYKDEDGLFDGESGEDISEAGEDTKEEEDSEEEEAIEEEPRQVRGGGLLSSFGFGRKEDEGDKGSEDELDATSDGKKDGSIGNSEGEDDGDKGSEDELDATSDGKKDGSLDTPRSSSDRASSRCEDDDDGSEVVMSDGPPPRKHRNGGSPSPLHREDCSPSPVNTNPTFHCGLEVKTITNKKLKRKFDLVEQVCGRFSHCDFGDNNFKLLVWDPKYRTQLLHHATVVDLDYVLFVVANESTIRYATLVYIPEVKRNTYREILVGVFQRSLKWATL